MSAPLSDEVDTVMRNYFAALSSKDEDIFKLYEDNKRMRTLVGDTLKAREDLEASSKSQASLIASLRAELHEKKCLIEAQDEESRVLREGITDLRVLLDCSQESHFGLQDVVFKVGAILNERDSLQEGLKAARNRHQHSLQVALMDDESRERLQLEGAAQVLYHSSLAWLCCHQAETIGRLEDEVSQHRRAAAQELVVLTEELELSSKRLELEAARHARHIEKMSMQLAELKAHSFSAKLDLLEQQGRGDIALEAMVGLIQHVWVPWCVVIKRSSWQEAAARRALEENATGIAKQLGLLQVEHSSTLSTLKSAQLAQKRLQKQMAKLGEKVNELEVCRDALQRLRVKHAEVVKRLHKTQQQHQIATEGTAEAMQEREKCLVDVTKKADRLMQQKAFLYDDIKALERRLGVLTTRAESFETQCHHLRKEKQLMMCESETKVAALEHQIQGARQECEERLAAERVNFQAQVNKLEEELEEWKERWKQSQDSQTEQKQRFAAEVEKWSSLADTLKAQLTKSNAQLEREHTVRQVLENQQRTESGLLARLLASSSMNTSAVTPDKLADMTSSALLPHCPHDRPVVKSVDRNVNELAQTPMSEKQLQQQVQVLKQSCRKSAAVISELRESLYRERMERANDQR